MAAEKEETKSAYKEPSAFKNFIAGGVGGIVVVAIGHPFDTVKVHTLLATSRLLCVHAT